MVDYGSELPEGYALDEPMVYGSELPEGFTLDEPPADVGISAPAVPGETTEQLTERIKMRGEELEAQGVSDDEAQRQLINEFWDQGQLEQEVAERKDLTPLAPPSTIEALVGGAKAFPASSKKQLTDLYKMVTNPGQTWEGLKTVAKDVYKNQMEVALKDMGFDPSAIKFKEGALLENIEQTPALDMVIDDYKKIYGSGYGEFKRAFAKDPARIMVELGSVLFPAAKGAQASAISKGLPTVAKVTGAIAEGAALTEPITQITKAVAPVSKLIGAPMKFLGEKVKPTKLYQSAAKMSTVISEADRAKLVQTALDEGILPNLEGLDKIDGIIANLDNKIAEVIETAQTKNIKMPVDEIFKDFEKLEEIYKLSGKASESISALNQLKKSFRKANADMEHLTPKKAQQFKQRIYKDLRSYYEAVQSSPASVEGQKAMARASKEFLEGIAPEIKGMNKRDGAMIALRNAIEKPASRIQSRSIMGLGMGVKTGVGTTIGHTLGSPQAGVVAGIAFAILTDPIVQSKIAITLNKSIRQGKKMSESTTANLVKMGYKQVKKGGKMVWTPPNRAVSVQLLKAAQQEKEK